jgi:hypothetical protein
VRAGQGQRVPAAIVRPVDPERGDRRLDPQVGSGPGAAATGEFADLGRVEQAAPAVRIAPAVQHAAADVRVQGRRLHPEPLGRLGRADPPLHVTLPTQH